MELETLGGCVMCTVVPPAKFQAFRQLACMVLDVCDGIARDAAHMWRWLDGTMQMSRVLFFLKKRP